MAETNASTNVALAGGRLKFSADSNWKQVEPKVRLIEHEFSVPAAEGDPMPGRITMMGARGTVEQNLQRWMGQFSQPEKEQATAEVAKVLQRQISGLDVHVLDVEGIYHDRRGGPFSPPLLRKDYRMLGVIVETADAGKFFVKFYGPKNTVEEHREAFQKMIEGLEWKP